MPSLPTITKSPPRFEPPEVHLNEIEMRRRLSLPLTGENFYALVTTNFLVALAAYDHKVTRDYFEKLLVTTFNFQNRMVRCSELGSVIDKIEGGEPLILSELKEEMGAQLAAAEAERHAILKTMELFAEMRGPEDSVS